MSTEDQDLPPRGSATGRAAYRIYLLALLGAGAVIGTGLVVARMQPPSGEPALAGEPTTPAASKELKDFAAKYFPNWPVGQKPELVILVTGQQHNYEGPCGCTEPQFGGLERRYNLFSQIRGLGLSTVAVDLGDIYYTGRHKEQAELKYRLSMKALGVMEYDAIAIGQEETRIPLIEGLATTVLQNNFPYAMLGANIANKGDFPGLDGSMIKNSRVVEPKGSSLKVGIIGTIGREVEAAINKIDPSIKFIDNGKAIPAALEEIKPSNPDLRVLLYQGTEEEAKKLAQYIDAFDMIVCRSAGSEPPGQPVFAPAVNGQRPRARIVSVGHKGRYVGVMAVFRTPQGLDLRWELIALGAEFRTPSEQQEANLAIQLLEGYTKELKDKDFLDRFPKTQHPLAIQFNKPNLKYIGSEACKKCHPKEFEIWDEHRHAGAYQTLSEHPKAKPPHNRHYDSECVICHTVGFGYQTGFRDRSAGYTTAEKSAHLMGVGCENCHGPGSLHADDPTNKQYALTMSPWKENPGDYLTKRAIEGKEKVIPAAERKVADKVFQLCFQCHDTDNDHNFTLEKWFKLAHGKGPTAPAK